MRVAPRPAGPKPLPGGRGGARGGVVYGTTTSEVPKNKPRHPGPRGSGELGGDYHSQQVFLAG